MRDRVRAGASAAGRSLESVLRQGIRGDRRAGALGPGVLLMVPFRWTSLAARRQSARHRGPRDVRTADQCAIHKGEAISGGNAFSDLHIEPPMRPARRSRYGTGKIIRGHAFPRVFAWRSRFAFRGSRQTTSVCRFVGHLRLSKGGPAGVGSSAVDAHRCRAAR